ncbi:hypothetical protein L202_04650 [Cryptococcus amylolentus CBS 6039]|uniref:Uncharacterized protein n=2 Tax=Cryptococcus amylolentus TaxID=104669 RepID=A0A1E3HP40_9TREE|nr:hypothetical protein L202_04650 [Cryptococcus amylolentus CBS 6039]ODN77476.1 hypothetical protein L202_04650 [Cryptococcus amylolentus CBS 6039]ODO05524.1 hypothetical protein I350_04575 [Cryptococcus amylolentus CBS 6273]
MATQLALDLRLRTLEAQLFGTPPSSLAAPKRAPQDGAATRRVREIHERLQRLGERSEGVKRLLDGYEQYLPLLTIPHPSTSTMTDQASDESQPIQESDLLPDSVKLAMVLAAAEDIVGAERDLRELEVLKGKGAEGSGQLEDLIPQRPDLIRAMQESENEGEALAEARSQVGGLLVRYTDFTSTVSELFIDLHHKMENLEEGVARVERKRRKELAERY